VQAAGWRLPAYWRRSEGQPGRGGDHADSGAAGFEEFTLHGWRPLNRAAPVSHLSFFEADAFARWSGCRLPTEAEWEHAACRVPVPAEANLLERGLLRAIPAAAASDAGLKQLWGDLWEWTASPYVPYPGFKASPGAVGEYNGKFMCNQYVLRGGSFATSRSHIRASYRNFFPVDARWQFTGLRLARDGSPTGDPSPRS
jgi:ergothioneine biosynthesis protein EgtB